MNILLCLSTRYPTQKAYGVTTFQTAKALHDIGHSVHIVAPQNIDNSICEPAISDCVGVVSLGIVGQSILWRLYTKSRTIVARCAFMFFRFLFALKVRRFAKSIHSPYFWVRDPLLALILNGIHDRHCVLLEIHRRPSTVDSILINLLGKRKRVILGFITPTLETLVTPRLTIARRIILPVGVANHFFNAEIEIQNMQLDGKIMITYVGKGKSSGNDNNLGVIIKAAKLAQEAHLEWRFKIVGLENEMLTGIAEATRISSIPIENLDSSGHIEHLFIQSVLFHSNMFVIPYPESEYYEDAFSIKLLEYAASGRPIIASNTKAHRAVLNESLAWFFDPKEPQSLIDVISMILQSPEDALDRVRSAQNWAREYLYSTRAETGLTAFHSIIRDHAVGDGECG